MNTKEQFETPSIEMIEIQVNDVIATSGPDLIFDLPNNDDSIGYGIAE